MILVLFFLGFYPAFERRTIYDYYLQNGFYFFEPLKTTFSFARLDNTRLYNTSPSVSLNLNSAFCHSGGYDFFFFPTFVMSAENFSVVSEPMLRIGGACYGWPDYFWKDRVAGVISRGFLTFESMGFWYSLGRERLSLYEGGLIDERNPPLDGFFWGRNGRRFSFFHGLASFNPEVLYTEGVGEVGKLYDRFLALHGFSLNFKHIVVSFSETALFFTHTNILDFYFLNPLSLYHVRFLDTQEYGEHNVFWILYLGYTRGRFVSTVELLVDDFHIPDVPVWAPPKLAWIFKNYFVVDSSKVLFLTYTGATRWTYTHGINLLYYKNKGESLGAFQENDFDKLRLDLVLLTPRRHSGVYIFFKRKGEASVEDIDPYWAGRDYPREYFLTGLVEKRFGQGWDVVWRHKKILLYIVTEHDFIWNKGHEKGKFGNEWRFKVLGTVRLL